METMLLREQQIYPSEVVLKHALGSAYPAFEYLMEALTVHGMVAHLYSKPVGKLLPLTISVNSREQIDDLVRIAEYEKSLK
jgi:hypothetical protein